MRPLPTKSGFLDGGMKTVATIASTGAALVSIITFLHAWGIVGDPMSRASFGNLGAKWIGVRPLVDTARTVGDTVHLAATITDKAGSILVGAHPTWTSEDPAIATVEQDGSVVARGPGATTIIAVAGEVSARMRIVVHQTVTAVRIAGDSAIAMREGDTRMLDARAFDARGYVVPGRTARWTSQDAGAVSFDSAGRAMAVDAGRAIVTATVDGVGAQGLVTVAPSPATIAIVKGDAQRARAGETLRERLVVRVANHRGRPVEGTLVRFRPLPDDGVVDPAAVVTDADGRARTTWTLADRPGRQRLAASVERVDSAIAFVAEADPVAANTRMVAVADSVMGAAGGVDTVAVRLTDSTGRALPDVPMSWSTSDGAVSAIDARSDSLGVARAAWTLGRTAGMQHARARVAGDAPPLTLVARVTHGLAATVSLDRAKSATAPGRSIAVTVRVADRFGNPVPRANARLQPRSGTIAPATVVTDSTGRAAAVWSLSDKPAEQQLVVALRGVAASDTLVIRQASRPKSRPAAARSPR